jgi:hypothetical protein
MRTFGRLLLCGLGRSDRRSPTRAGRACTHARAPQGPRVPGTRAVRICPRCSGQDRAGTRPVARVRWRLRLLRPGVPAVRHPAGAWARRAAGGLPALPARLPDRRAWPVGEPLALLSNGGRRPLRPAHAAHHRHRPARALARRRVGGARCQGRVAALAPRRLPDGLRELRRLGATRGRGLRQGGSVG